jgi:hypothetical protein
MKQPSMHNGLLQQISKLLQMMLSKFDSPQRKEFKRWKNFIAS